MNKKGIYRYNRQNVCIAKVFHSLSNPFLKQELEEDVKVEKGSLVITLTPKTAPRKIKIQNLHPPDSRPELPEKTLRHAANTPQKHKETPLLKREGSIKTQILHK